MTTHNRQLLNSARICDVFGVTKMTLWRWQRNGLLPKPTRIAGRNYWPANTVEKVLETARERELAEVSNV